VPLLQQRRPKGTSSCLIALGTHFRIGSIIVYACLALAHALTGVLSIPQNLSYSSICQGGEKSFLTEICERNKKIVSQRCEKYGLLIV
jgi:hypothetical protein